MAQSIKEVAHLRGDDKKFEENYNQIDWSNSDTKDELKDFLDKPYETPYYISPTYRSKLDNDFNNKLYALINSRLEGNESRGFNGHTKTQSLMVMITQEIDEWLEMQK